MAETMKAIQFIKHGPPDVLELRDIPIPTRKHREVLIRIYATSVNPVDYKLRKGCGDVPVYISKPFTPGSDVAGEVVEVDEHSLFKPGDRVFAMSSILSKEGSYAEYISIPEEYVARMPSNLSYEEAAGIPLVGLTVWQSLVEKGRLDEKPGQKVLVHAGSGGVGSFAIQLAKHVFKASEVATTCSKDNFAYVKDLGADLPIDYQSTDFETVVSNYDMVLDSLGGEVEKKSRNVLHKHGYLGSIITTGYTAQYGRWKGLLMNTTQHAWHWTKQWFAGPHYSLTIVHPDGKQLEKIANLYDKGLMKPTIDRVFPLENAKEAHEYLEQGHVRGKVILRVRSAETSAQ